VLRYRQGLAQVGDRRVEHLSLASSALGRGDAPSISLRTVGGLGPLYAVRYFPRLLAISASVMADCAFP